MSEKKSIVQEAKERYARARDINAENRRLAVEDTKFVMGDSDNGWQWPEFVRQSRETEKRVCLTVNMTAQHCNQIINNIRMNRPAVKVSPADDHADKKTAEILGGVIRQIQAASAADEAHDTAAEHSVYGGEGYWRVLTEYESPKSFNQVIRIVGIQNPQNVLIDPDAKAPDKSDAKWGMIFDDIPKETVKREYGIDAQNFGPIDNEWIKEGTVMIAEYFYCESQKKTLVMLSDGSTAFKDELPEEMPEGFAILQERETHVDTWKWCKLIGGHDKPVDEREWLGKYLPIMTVVGKELNVNGQIVRKGIVRDLKDPGRMVNYAYSETVQGLALQNKTPYMAAAEAIEGHEDIWGAANLEDRAYLPFNALDDAGNALPVPQRQPPPILPAAQVQLLQLSTEQMRAASGQQNANFGIKAEASSGVGIQRLKAQGEIATFHFPDNLARALRYEAKVLIDLIQKYYDSRRIVRILGLDGKQEQATLDPELPTPYQEEGAGEEVERIFNPTVGEYDVVIDTGPSFQTLRQEAAAHLNELAAKNPALLQIAGDLIMRAQDFPMADKLADRLAKTLPPGLQDEKNGQPQIPPQLMQQMQAMNQAIQGLTAELDQKDQELAKAKDSMVIEFRKLLIDAYAKETDRIKAVGGAMSPEAVQALVIQTLTQVLNSPDPTEVAQAPPVEVLQEEPPSGGFSLPEEGMA